MVAFVLTLIPIIVPIACLYFSYETYKIVKKLEKNSDMEKEKESQ